MWRSLRSVRDDRDFLASLLAEFLPNRSHRITGDQGRRAVPSMPCLNARSCGRAQVNAAKKASLEEGHDVAKAGGNRNAVQVSSKDSQSQLSSS